MIVTRPRDRWTYVLKAELELPEPEQTKFELGDLLERDRALILDLVTSNIDPDDEDAIPTNAGTQAYKILRLGLRGWSNVKDEEGNEIPFVKDGRFASDESLALLPFRVKGELMGELMKHAFPTEADKEK